MLNRTNRPVVIEPEQLAVQKPEFVLLPNGIPLNILNVGDNDVMRVDLLMGEGAGSRPALCNRCSQTACYVKEPNATLLPR